MWAKIGGCSSEYLDFPNCSRGELLEFSDLFVAKVACKYHNFPFCSWICLLSSISLESSSLVFEVAGSALVIRSKSIWCGGGGVISLMGVWSGSLSSVEVSRARGVLLLLLQGVAWLWLFVVAPPTIIPKVKSSWGAVGSVAAC